MRVKKCLALVMAISMITLTACAEGTESPSSSAQQISEQGVMEGSDQSYDVNDSSNEINKETVSDALPDDSQATNNNQQQTDDKQQNNTSNNNDNIKEQLIGTWVCEHPKEDGYVYTYIFRADGTAKFLNLRKEVNYTDEYNFTEYSFDGNILELTGPNENGGGGFSVISHIVAINGSSLTEEDTGNVYIKE